MRSEQMGNPGLSARFFLLMAAIGAMLGVVLVTLGAPGWAFYVAPLVMVPFLVHELRVVDAEESPRRDSAVDG